MATLTVAFDLTEPCFRYECAFEFDDRYGPKLIEVVSQAASDQGIITLDEYLRACVIRAPQFLRDEDQEFRTRVMECIAAWGLRLPTEQRKCHGLIGDYIAAYDFAILITSVGTRGIGYKVRATLRADIAGTA